MPGVELKDSANRCYFMIKPDGRFVASLDLTMDETAEQFLAACSALFQQRETALALAKAQRDETALAYDLDMREARKRIIALQQCVEEAEARALKAEKCAADRKALVIEDDAIMGQLRLEVAEATQERDAAEERAVVVELSVADLERLTGDLWEKVNKLTEERDCLEKRRQVWRQLCTKLVIWAKIERDKREIAEQRVETLASVLCDLGVEEDGYFKDSEWLTCNYCGVKDGEEHQESCELIKARSALAVVKQGV